MKEITINKNRNKLKVWSVVMPNAPYSNRRCVSYYEKIKNEQNEN